VGTQLAVCDEPDYLDVTLASLETPEAVRPSYHIWTVSRIGWFYTAVVRTTDPESSPLLLPAPGQRPLQLLQHHSLIHTAREDGIDNVECQQRQPEDSASVMYGPPPVRKAKMERGGMNSLHQCIRPRGSVAWAVMEMRAPRSS
jgi:hypothetical protein